jgi:hypothetical protein
MASIHELKNSQVLPYRVGTRPRPQILNQDKNDLAYLLAASATKKKSIVRLTPADANVIKLFTAVSYEFS